MNRNTLWFIFVLLVAYLTLVFCDELETTNQDGIAVQSERETTDLVDEGRTRRRHHALHHLWPIALGIAYWVKVKLVIVAFFVGSAVFVGLRYVWPHKCDSGVVHEGPIIYDHPPPSFSHHDHIPYSFDHSDHFDHSYESSASSFEPYSGYTGEYSDVPPTSSAPETHRIGRRSVVRKRPMATEEQIAEFMFSFLGLDSKACRRRFVCEMEFRSKENPLTAMAFRIVGRGFFGRYTNSNNQLGQATSFAECAVVNSECVFIEQNTEEEDETTEHEVEPEMETDAQPQPQPTETAANLADLEQNNSAENNLITNSDLEGQNAVNLLAEKRTMRRRGDRKMNVVAERILKQINDN